MEGRGGLTAFVYFFPRHSSVKADEAAGTAPFHLDLWVLLHSAELGSGLWPPHSHGEHEAVDGTPDWQCGAVWSE